MIYYIKQQGRLEPMLSVSVSTPNMNDPASALQIGDTPSPVVPPGWTRVLVRAASLNHHDVWSARGVGLGNEDLPRVLGCDAAGIDEDGRPVLVHSVISSADWRGDEMLDPDVSILSERHDGTFAEQVTVPSQNLIPLPPGMSFEEAACLPTAWLTAFRMLFIAANLKPGATILVQGGSGGLSSALIALSNAAGVRVWATGRTNRSRNHAISVGADMTFEPGAVLPQRVDAVMDSVGAPTWDHSLKALRKGGTLVVAGATGGYTAETSVARIFANCLRVVGSAMGSRAELSELVNFCVAKGIRPTIHSILPLREARQGFEEMIHGNAAGKIVFNP